MTRAKRVPGEGGIWLLIGGELLAFSAFFLIFAYYRNLDPVTFAHGQDSLNGSIGLANTLILLTSSLFVALGVRRVRDTRQGSVTLFRAALGLGLVFIVLKLLEYSEKLTLGITPLTNDFYIYYFAFTGIHLMHVVLGCAALSVMAYQAKKRAPSSTRTMIVESCATFWHLVDLLWIMLFALFYVAGSSYG